MGLRALSPVADTAAPDRPAVLEYPMTTEDLRRITARAQTVLGHSLGERKRQMVYSRLSRRLRALGIGSFGAYLDLLDAAEGETERERFANALTTNLTAFFRETHHFAHFEREVVRRNPVTAGRLRVWSAGCSTGEEAYGIAMIVHAQAAALAAREPRILATDLDTEVLETARRGLYLTDRLRGLPDRFRTQRFLDEGPQGALIRDEVQRLVAFRALNLIEPWPFREKFEFIFCRNVLIYFPAEIKARMIDRFAEALRPDGFLYLGHSESLHGAHPRLAAEGQTIYRRIGR